MGKVARFAGHLLESRPVLYHGQTSRMGLLSAQIETKAMVPACRQLATTYEAGIPILKGFQHVARETKDPKVKRVFRDIAEDLQSGNTLADAVHKQEKYLSPFFIHLLASGEQGGHLDVMLQDLASYFEDRLAMQRSVIAAMAYPVVMLFLAFHLGTFAIGLIRRVLSTLDARGGPSGVNLIFDYVADWLRFVFGSWIVFALLAAALIFLARQGALRWITGAITTHVWPLSRVTRSFAMARFFRSLALLVNSGLGITQCIRGAASVTANPYIEKDLVQAVPRVQNGATLVEAFAPSRYMTRMGKEMLTVAEESGRLDHHLKKASEYHLNEANQAVKVSVTVFSTLLVLLVVGVVGAVIIMFYVNLYGGMMDALGI